MTVAGAVWGGAARSALSGLGFCLFCFGFFPLCGGVGGVSLFFYFPFVWVVMDGYVLWFVYLFLLLVYIRVSFLCKRSDLFQCFSTV